MVDVTTDESEGGLQNATKRLRSLIRARPGEGSSLGVARRFASLAYGFRIANAGIAFLTQIALARWMGAHDFGIYIYVWTWVILLGTVTNVGLASSPQRFVPVYTERGDMDRLRGFLVGGPGSPSAWRRCVPRRRSAPCSSPAIMEPWLLVPFLLGLGCLPLFVLTEVQEGIARAYDWPVIALAPRFLVRPLLLLAIIAGLYMAGIEPDAAPAPWAPPSHRRGSRRPCRARGPPAAPRRVGARAPRTHAPGEWLPIPFPSFWWRGSTSSSPIAT